MASSSSGFTGSHNTAHVLLNPKAAQMANGTSSSHSSLSSSFPATRAFSAPPSLGHRMSDSPLHRYAYSSPFQGQRPSRPTPPTNGTPSSNHPAFSPHALLDPRGYSKPQLSATNGRSLYSFSGAGLSPETPATPTTNSLTTKIESPKLPDMGTLIERVHGVAQRENRPLKRQKVDAAGPVDEAQRKPTFAGGGKGGVIGEYMREQKEAGRAEAAKSGSVVDLTNVGDEDDVVVVSDSAHKEVCFGRLEGARVQAHQVPAPKPTARTLDPDFWPVIKVDVRRRGKGTHIISVSDALGNDFGTVHSVTAIGLAPLMDAQEPGIRVQARIPSRRRLADEVPGSAVSRYYDLSINLYGQKRHAVGVGRFLSQKQIWLRTPLGVDAGIETVNPQAAPPPRTIPSGPGGGSVGGGYVTRTVEEIRNDVVGMFDSLQNSDNLPEMEPDPRILTPLLGHQKQALHFLTTKEKARVFSEQAQDHGSLWRLRLRNNGQRMYYNVITGKEERVQPPEVLGGILADMMGLGKTLSILSLVVSTLDEATVWAGQTPPLSNVPAEMPLLHNAKTTLLVSPLSTIANWEEQIKTHVQPGTLSYYIYHGSNRCNDLGKLASYDLVITTYSVVSSEFDRRSKKMKQGGAVSPLEQTNWFRIVLDEGHMIREQSTRQSKAICSLSAQRRWAVTGTPVQNRLDDLGALIKFLRIKPFDEKGGFVQFILSPFKNADPEILPKLRLLVDSITLRRLKDRIDLPPRHDHIVRLRFTAEEQALYDHFAKDSDRKMRIVAGEKQQSLGGKAYVHILRAILRLRLICAHGKALLGEEDLKVLEGISRSHAIELDDDDEAPGLTAKQAYDTFSLMRETNADACNQCDRRIGAKDASVEEGGPGKDDVVGYMTPCYQLLCKDCIAAFREAMQQNAVDASHGNCPLCGSFIKMSYFGLRQHKIDDDDEARTAARDNPKLAKQLGRYEGPHTKTRALLESLLASRQWSEAHAEERPIKSVVFSGWTSHLDLIQLALDEQQIPYTRLDGKMSRVQRGQALELFRDSATVTVILVSITAGGLGLNLTAGSRVYVMEPQFNPAAEAQAIDRVHRLGQTREVTATRFIMEGSFEEKMLELQRKKQNLADLSMNRVKLDKHEATKRRLEELRSLFK